MRPFPQPDVNHFRQTFADTGATLEIWPARGAGAVLFYPGSMLCPTHYIAFLDALARAGFTVGGLHLPGHGLAVKTSRFSFTDLLQAGLCAEKWLHANGYGPVAICGHSQGGILTLAHAAMSDSVIAAFALGAIDPALPEAIALTRFRQFGRWRESIMAVIRFLAKVAPTFPIPLPFYLSMRRLLKGKAQPVIYGYGSGRQSYPLAFLSSLFEAKISHFSQCPVWIFSAKNDALFGIAPTLATFRALHAPRKRLIWLETGGHLAPMNPILGEFIARTMACACASLGFPLNLEMDRGIISKTFIYQDN